MTSPIDRPSPDKPADAVAAAWEQLQAAPGPPGGTVFRPRRPPGHPVGDAEVTGRALYEPDFRTTHLLLYRDCPTDLYYAVPLRDWPALFYPQPDIPDPPRDRLDRAVDELLAAAPARNAPFRHYKGGLYLVLAGVLIRNRGHVAPAVAYRSADRGTDWVRLLDDFFRPVRLESGAISPRFYPDVPVPADAAT